MITKIDYLIAALIGFLTGIFAIPTVLNLGVRNKLILLLLPWVLAPLWIFGVWLGRFLSRWVSFMLQFGKYAAVGFLNTAIDFGILNILSMVTGVTKGFIIGGVNIPGFLVASFNSYLWNKFWVFKKVDERGVFHDFLPFFLVTLIGILVNGVIVILLTTYVSPLFGFDAKAWLNLSKVFATAVTFVWNFTGYKFLVFRSRG